MKRPRISELPHILTSCMLGMIMTGWLSTPALANPDAEQQEVIENPAAVVADEIVFARNQKTDWRLYLGSMTNWMVPIQGPETSSYKSKSVIVRTVDYQGKADAYQAEWNGGLAQVYWQRQDAMDLNALESKGAALSMVIRVDKKPKKSVELKMDCGYPCAGTLNMTKLFKAVPQGRWFRASFSLSCFKEAGANLSNILAPLVVATKDDFKMSFSDVRILTDPPPESIVACG